MQIIDLTRTIEDGMAVFPGHPPVNIARHFSCDRDGRNVECVSMGSHTGTHVDVPYHFLNHGFSSESISLPAICGAVKLLDFTHKKGAPITADDMQAHADALATFKKIVIWTGWQHRGRAYYEKAPTLSLPACELICDLQVQMVGMDMPSPGPHGKEGNAMHALLLEKGVYIIEGLTNLNRIAHTEFTLICLPLYLKGAGGAPCRAIAIQPEHLEFQ